MAAEVSFRVLKPTSEVNVRDSASTTASAAPSTPLHPNDSLKAGMPLPKIYHKQFPAHLIGIPIEDIDPFYKDKKTFVVISSNWHIHRFSNRTSIGVLDVFNWLRWLAIRTICHRIFHYFMVTVMIYYLFCEYILGRSDFLLQLNRYILIGIFTLELNLKLIAYGVIRHPFSYFQNPWNWLDFLMIIVIGVAAAEPTRFHAIYAIEALRALKLIELFPLARSSFIAAFKNVLLLKDLMIYFGFMFATFTLYALHAYQGGLHYRCISNDYAWNETEHNENDTSFYMPYCGNTSGSMLCPENFTCLANRGQNPNYGYTNFDNIGYSALGILSLITRDYWENLYTYIHYSFGRNVILFFSTVLVFGNFIFNNLFASYIAIGVGRFVRQLEGKAPLGTQRRQVPISGPIATSGTIDSSHKDTLVDTIRFSDLQKVEERSSTNEQDIPSSIEIGAVLSQSTGSQGNRETSIDRKPVSEDTKCPFQKTIADVLCGWSCCCQCCVRIQNKMAAFLLHKYFEYFIYTIITVHYVCMVSIHHGMTYGIGNAIDFTVLSIIFIYIVEAILKIIALTPRKYFADGWNQFDCLVAALCAIEITLLMGIAGLSFSFPLLRILRLGKTWKRLGFISKMKNYSFLMVFMVLSTISHIGYISFGHSYIDKFDEPTYNAFPRWHLATSLHSIETTVRAVAGEWIESLWEGLAVADYPWLVFIYFITVIIVGYLLVTNLFISIVMNCLDTSVLLETDHLIDNNPSQGVIHRLLSRIFRKHTNYDRNREMMLNGDNGLQNEEDSEEKEANDSQVNLPQPMAEPPPCCCECWYSVPSFRRLSVTTGERGSVMNNWTSLRRKVYVWSNNSIWNAIMTVVIILSCIPFAFGLDDHLPMTRVHYIMNVTITVLFMLDIVIKITGEGCKTYFRNSWSQFDFIVTVSHICLNVVYGANAIRVLRLIPRMQCLRVVIEALNYRISILMESILINAIFWTMFAVMFLTTFNGRFYKCHDEKGNVIGVTIENCRYENHTWSNSHVNFDNIGNSFIALIHLATLKGWNNVWITVSGRHGNLLSNSISFGFIIVGTLIGLAIIVAAFIVKVNAQRKEIGGGYIDILMTDSQRKRVSIERKRWFMAAQKLVPPNETGIGRHISHIVHSNIFDGFVITLLLINSIVLALQSYEPDVTQWRRTLQYASLSLIIVFNIEIVLRILVYRGAYFQKLWSIYDLIVVTGSLISWTVTHLFHIHYIPGYWWGLLLVFRLIRWLKWVKRIIHMIRICMPAILNVWHLILVVMFFYSVTGMQLFDHVTPHHLHSFHTIQSSMSLMLEIALGGAWDDVYERMATEGHLATLFLLSYLFICYFIFISSGTVIFMENYHRLYEKMRLGISDDNLENFTKVWQTFDPEASGTIASTDLSDLMHHLDTPFQIAKPNDLMIDHLGFPIDKTNRVKFGDVLQTIIYNLDDEKKVPKPILTEEEEKPASFFRRIWDKAFCW